MTSAAFAAPITLSKANAVADARRDVGEGICGSITHFKTQPQPLSQLGDAVALLNKPATDPNVLGRKSAILGNMNFKVADPSSGGDFTLPNFIDDVFPFSADANAMPPGDNNNIAMRIRGYLNVNNTLSGQPVTFGVLCDDACSLTIGKQVIIPIADERISGRVTQQVIFKDTGLYPVEVVYYQNATAGYFEWSKALSAEAEGNQNSSLDTNKFKIIAPADLYSSIIGSNPGCQECGAPGMDCTAGSYCGDGLCQACNSADHCGPTCVTCPANARICSTGKCVECLDDSMCPSGLSCGPEGRCVPPTPCNATADCAGQNKVCDPDTKTCQPPPIPCKIESECPTGWLCGADYKCHVKPTPCNSDSQCQYFQYCDTASQTCKSDNAYKYDGGFAGCSMGSSSPNGGSRGSGLGLLALMALALVGLGALRRRSMVAVSGSTHTLRAQSMAVRAATLLLPVFFCAVATDAHAQNSGISLNAQLFRPALGPENIFTVEGSRTPGKWVPLANVVFEYARQPLHLTDVNGANTGAVVPDMVTLHLMGGIGLTRWFSVGLDLPVVVYQGYQRPVTGDVRMDPSSAGIGDLRLIGKIRIIDNTEGGFGFAFAPQITFPTGDGQQFRGDDAFGFEPRLALDYKTKGGIIIAFNGSILLRTSSQDARNVKVSHQVRYGIGALFPVGMGFALAAEVAGGTSFFNSESLYSPLEAYVGGRWVHRSGINLNLGGGPGLTPVAGTAQFRLFASIGYLPLERKKEPPKKVVVDLDPDRDGLIGANDRCPNEWGPPENQGCPDIDTDKDGLVDRLDKCPKEPGPKENNGCPDTDRDGDGLVDRLDSCPDQPGPLENNGCPLMDTDKDGIPDKDDKCPYEPGPKENNGCPPARKYIQVTDQKIELLQKIMFATNKADIKPASFDLLNEVIDVMKHRPSMKVHIEGHTDIRGTLQLNMKLSKARADSVRQYLADHGVETERMTAEGYGPTRPLCPDKTSACFDKNRRTEFVIVQQ